MQRSKRQKPVICGGNLGVNGHENDNWFSLHSNWRDCEKVTYTGFLAQEVEQAALAVGYDFSGYTKPQNDQQFYTIRYAEFVVPIVKAMQEQQLIIAQLRQQNDGLQKRLIANLFYKDAGGPGREQRKITGLWAAGAAT